MHHPISNPNTQNPVSCTQNQTVQLSIIIVNYNVRYFLEQCLHSVLRASAGLETECFVIDNGSADGSIDYLKPLFPSVRFIENEANPGFAKANNQVLPLCTGEYILFLNPDTLIPEDAFRSCLAYMKAQPAAGALGVRMVDGRGRFLPESKRSFPSPLTAFFKLTGLAGLFPHSGLFNRYALGNLNEHSNHKVAVLAGACLLVKRELLLQLQGFDENYFLYGEDIDLSYRICQAGYENHYFAGTTILHFKGESAGSNSLRHVKYFYEAMQVFVRKHYQGSGGKLLVWFLQLAILLRGFLSAGNRLVKPILWPLADLCTVWVSLLSLRFFWVQQFRHGKDFGVYLLDYGLPLFSLFFVSAAAFAGLYDRRTRIPQLFSSLVFALISLLALYSLLPETLRFSRGVMLCGSSLAVLIMLLQRRIFQQTGQDSEEEATVVVASAGDYQTLLPLLQKEMVEEWLLGRLSPQGGDMEALGSLAALPTLSNQLGIKRVIFCIGDLRMKEALPVMQVCRKQSLRFLFHVAGSNSMVGSQTRAPGTRIITPFVSYAISQPYQQRMKRVVDLVMAVLFLVSLPVHIFMQPNPTGFLKNMIRVLLGKRTWVGYASALNRLPVIKAGIVSSLGNHTKLPSDAKEQADQRYAKQYDWWEDARLVIRYYRQLGG